MFKCSNFEPKKKHLQAILTEDELALIEAIRDYVDDKIIPKRSDIEGGWYKDEKVAIETIDDLYAGLVSLGFQKASIPIEYGGLGLSPLVRLCMNEELARGDISFAAHACKVHWLMGLVIASKNQTLINMLLPKAVSDEPWTAMVGFNEPQGGGNIEDITQEGRSLRVTARLSGDHYFINGRKLFASPGGPPECFERKNLKGHMGCIFVATTDPELGRDGIGHFYVPIDSKGLSFGEPYETMGCAYTDRNCDIYLDDVRIPKEYRLCSAGEDAKLFYGITMSGGRLSQAARLTGVSQALAGIALDWTSKREIHGRPVREYSLFAGIFGEILRDIECSRAFYSAVAWMLSNPDKYGYPWEKFLYGKCAAAKSVACRCITNTIDKVMDLMGAMGLCYETKVEKYIRDMWIYKIGLASPERDLLDTALAYYPFDWNPES